MADNGPMIIELDRKRMTAMAEKDIATLNAVLADDLIYTHSSARLDTKGAHPRHFGRQAERLCGAVHRRLRQQGRQMADGDLAIHPPRRVIG
jgi:ketosteroid isomerase-like protein